MVNIKYWTIFIIISVNIINNTIVASHFIDKVAAIVNNNIILESEVNNIFTIIKHNAQNNNQYIPNDIILKHQILDELIIENIILQIAQHSNVSISNIQLNKVIANIATQNHMTLKQLYDYLVYKGITFNNYREQIYKKMLITKIRNNKVNQRFTISPQEVELLTQQIATETNDIEYHLSYILIPIRKYLMQDKIKQAKVLAQVLIKKSKNGMSFNKLLNNYSIKDQILQVRELGWKKSKDLPPLFTMYLQKEKKNNIIGPIYFNNNFYILRINAIRQNSKNSMVTEVCIRHIILYNSKFMTNQQAYNKLKKLAAQIKKGDISFTNAAKKLSKNKNSASKSVELYWSYISNFDPTIRNTLIHLKKGEVSMPIYSPLGWHLVQLVDSRQVYNVDMAQKNHAYQLLFYRKFTAEEQAWIQEIRASNYVKILESNEY